MKKIFFIVAVTFLTYYSYAVKPPAAVQNAFMLKFTAATEVKWSKENATEYEAEFVMDGFKMSANYRGDGSWLETESMIPVSKLPDVVIAAIVKHYPDNPIIEADRIERVDKETLYEVVIKTGMKKKEVILDVKGVIQE
jgi:hypothetical protein